MPYLRLNNVASGEKLEFEVSPIRVGRNPDSQLVVSGEGSHVVSGSHVRLYHEGGVWRIEDEGSRNGTFLDNRRLIPGASDTLSQGMEIQLGEAGPRFRVEAVAKRVIAETLVEGPATVRPSAPTMPMVGLDDAVPPPATPPSGPEKKPSPPSPPSPPPTLRVVVSEARTNERFIGEGERIRIGRGSDCELRPVAAGDTSVSRVHAEVTLRSDGKAVISDTGSRNGTIVNGRILVSEHELKKGDRVQLGDTGPELVVQEVMVRGAAVEEAVPAAVEEKAASLVSAAEQEAVKAKAKAAPRRSFGGVGRTVFIREVVEETQRKGSKRLRWVIWSFTALLAGVGGGLYWYLEWQTQATVEQMEARQREVFAAQQEVADSIRRAAEADFERLRSELERAQAGAAPAAVVESLRVALNEASERTTTLEASLRRAQSSLDRQLAMGDSLRRVAQRDLERMRSQLAQASTGGGGAPQALLDSLRQAVAAAEQNAVAIEDRLRAAKGVDLAMISQANQSAVGLVTAFFPDGIGDATGFVLSTSGYFVTNRHAVTEDGRMADSVKVTMADHRTQVRADVIRVAPPGGPDLALLKIRNYQGSHIQKLDWSGTHVRQGEPAALIGFPQGMALALDRTRTVRTSMSAGIFSKVVEDGIQFDGFTVGGSSGSPIFNANGEVVAVHKAGLRAGPGLSLAVPVKLLIGLMPPQLKAELAMN